MFYHWFVTQAYAELHCHTDFSFLDGASPADDLVERAVELGLSGLAVTDHQGLYGAVRFSAAAREAGQAQLERSVHQVVGRGRAVEEREIRVAMKFRVGRHRPDIRTDVLLDSRAPACAGASCQQRRVATMPGSGR